MEITEVLFIHVITSLIFALVGRNRSIGYGVTLLLCLLLSPAIGALIAVNSEKQSTKFTEVKKEDIAQNQEKTENNNTNN